MLVLSRKRNEAIEIAGGDVVITVIDIRGDKVRLGIEAPKEIDVHRREIAEKIRRESAKENEGKQKQEPPTVSAADAA